MALDEHSIPENDTSRRQFGIAAGTTAAGLFGGGKAANWLIGVTPEIRGAAQRPVVDCEQPAERLVETGNDWYQTCPDKWHRKMEKYIRQLSEPWQQKTPGWSPKSLLSLAMDIILPGINDKIAPSPADSMLDILNVTKKSFTILKKSYEFKILMENRSSWYSMADNQSNVKENYNRLKNLTGIQMERDYKVGGFDQKLQYTIEPLFEAVLRQAPLAQPERSLERLELVREILTSLVPLVRTPNDIHKALSSNLKNFNQAVSVLIEVLKYEEPDGTDNGMVLVEGFENGKFKDTWKVTKNQSDASAEITNEVVKEGDNALKIHVGETYSGDLSLESQFNSSDLANGQTFSFWVYPTTSQAKIVYSLLYSNSDNWTSMKFTPFGDVAYQTGEAGKKSFVSNPSTDSWYRGDIRIHPSSNTVDFIVSDTNGNEWTEKGVNADVTFDTVQLFGGDYYGNFDFYVDDIVYGPAKT
jgi:hypothetical protein